MKLRLALVLLPILLGGCGTQAAQDAAGGHSSDGAPSISAVGEGARTEPAQVDGLTCRSGMRGDGIADYISSTGGSATAEEAASAWAEPDDQVVIQGRSRSGASAYLLRPDGTAHTRLVLAMLEDGTWRVEGWESCGGQGP